MASFSQQIFGSAKQKTATPLTFPVYPLSSSNIFIFSRCPTRSHGTTTNTSWYGLGYEKDFPVGKKSFGISIFDEPLVVYRDGDGHLQCVSDLCPHRASKLSEGMVSGA